MHKPLLLLDLDNTLWDFDANAEEALSELFHRHHLHLRTGFKVHEFVSTYQRINKQYWKRYEKGEIAKDYLRTARFTDTFIEMGIPPEDHPESIWEEYLEICPVMTRVIPGAHAFLEEMKEEFQIGLLTNGFEKTQNLKIRHSGIEPYIQFMLTSESAGIAKPAVEIFRLAQSMSAGPAEKAYYLGDNWDTDVMGGTGAGFYTLWFNRDQSPLPEPGFTSNPYFLGQTGSLLEAGGIFSACKRI